MYTNAIAQTGQIKKYTKSVLKSKLTIEYNLIYLSNYHNQTD